STTTSGHGTISEGECSSILGALPLSSSAGVPGKSKSNGTHGGGTNNSATSNSVSTPGSGASAAAVAVGSSGGPIQRQPASSGYESTIQDDEDDFEGTSDDCLRAAG